MRKKFSEPELNVIEELSAKLLVANEKLRKSEEKRTKMLENISHDLRAPLTAIRSAVDYLLTVSTEEETDKDELRQIGSLLHERTKILENLIQDLYYLTCLDNKAESFDMSDIPLGQFLEEYFYMAEMDARYEDKKLNFDVSPSLTCVVRMDSGKMTRALDNLLINVAKYSPAGASITLGAFMTKAKEDAGPCAAIYIKDTGIGMTGEDLDKIFERLYMVSDARTPSGTSGSGLGLSIVKSIVEKHGGKITCMSELERGSCFMIYLPVVNESCNV